MQRSCLHNASHISVNGTESTAIVNALQYRSFKLRHSPRDVTVAGRVAFGRALLDIDSVSHWVRSRSAAFVGPATIALFTLSRSPPRTARKVHNPPRHTFLSRLITARRRPISPSQPQRV